MAFGKAVLKVVPGTPGEVSRWPWSAEAWERASLGSVKRFGDSGMVDVDERVAEERGASIGATFEE